MSNLPAKSEGDRARIELIKKTVAKGATDDELAMFLHLANKYNLDPLAKEIWFIKRVKKVKIGNTWDYPRLANGEIDYSNAETVIMTSRDGYLKAAQADPNFEGLQAFAVREGDEFEIDAENFKVRHVFGTKTKRGRILGAWAAAYHKQRRPVIVYADFEEYNADSPVWKQYPSAMIVKVAEVMALRRQFHISGLVAKEEMMVMDAEVEAQPEDGTAEGMAEQAETPHSEPADKQLPQSSGTEKSDAREAVPAPNLSEEFKALDFPAQKSTSKGASAIVKAQRLNGNSVITVWADPEHPEAVNAIMAITRGQTFKASGLFRPAQKAFVARAVELPALEADFEEAEAEPVNL